MPITKLNIKYVRSAKSNRSPSPFLSFFPLSPKNATFNGDKNPSPVINGKYGKRFPVKNGVNGLADLRSSHFYGLAATASNHFHIYKMDIYLQALIARHFISLDGMFNFLVETDNLSTVEHPR